MYNVGSQKQLFIDNRWFERQEGIQLKLNPPLRRERINWPGFDPWDNHGIHAYLNVIKDSDVYKMWYGGRPKGAHSSQLRMCYAESKDGINWTKPELNLFDIPEFKNNNIVIPGAYGSIMKDPHGPDEHRYKALCDIFPNEYWPDSQGCIHGGKQPDGSISYFMALYLITSPDGVHWKRQETFASPFFHDSQNQLLYDRRLKKYTAYLRWMTNNGPRSVARNEFDDPMSLPWPWRKNSKAKTGPGGTLERMGDEFDNVIEASPGTIDPPDSDVYCPCVCQYPWADDSYYFSFMPVYRHYPMGDTSDTAICGKDSRGNISNDGPIDVRIACSSNGVNWERSVHDPYLRLGTDWDSSCIYAAPGLIRNGDEIWQYYVGFPVTHGYNHSGNVGIAVQRLDGFISADTDYHGGSFNTPLMTFDGDELTINVDCSGSGNILVEIRDENDKPIPGFSLDDCITTDLNHISIPIYWKQNGKDLSALKGKPISLHFVMRDCKLYSFQFIKSS